VYNILYFWFMIDFLVFLMFKIVVYADPESVKSFYKQYGECAKELELPISEYICHISKLKEIYY